MLVSALAKHGDKRDKPTLYISKGSSCEVSGVDRNHFLCWNLNIYKSVTSLRQRTLATSASPTCSERAGVTWQTKRSLTWQESLSGSEAVWSSLEAGVSTHWCCGDVVTVLLLSLLLSACALQQPNFATDSRLTLSCRGLSRPVPAAPALALCLCLSVTSSH